jgi:hypothetical protein
MLEIHHALVLDIHQPSGNLQDLLDTQEKEWEAKEILFAYDRMARVLRANADLARVNVSFSGTLLETLSNPGLQERVYGIVKCGDLLNDLQGLQHDGVLEVLGTGYYHPLFALIPETDWDEQISRGLDSAGHFFPHRRPAGFWPPDLAFDMRLIPHLTQAGYRYVIVDDEYVRPIDPAMPWPIRRYRPHIAEFRGQRIIVIVRDRDLSKAQLAGMEADWLEGQLLGHDNQPGRLRGWDSFQDWHHGLPPLVTMATPGDNGGWFRNTDESANFWGHFYRPALDGVRSGLSLIRPSLISDYLDRFFNDEFLRQFGDAPTVTVERGAWNTEEHHGFDFTQWQGSQAQRATMGHLHDVSAAFRQRASSLDPDTRERAQWRILRAETGCHFFWGDAWLHKANADLEEALVLLGEASSTLGMAPSAPASIEVGTGSTAQRSIAARTGSSEWPDRLVRCNRRYNVRKMYRLIGTGLYSARIDRSIAEHEYELETPNVISEEHLARSDWRVTVYDGEICVERVVQI